ncbi:MAG TPA: hypothetical protein VHX65_18505 [Pirellulales bacterium]|nr:hypothetical protein [Pirellulales bacterium]
MKRTRRLAILAMLFTVLAIAPRAWAQKDAAPAASGGSASDAVLKAIPDDALGFVVIKDLAQTDKAISKLGAALQAPVPSVLSLFKLQAGIQEGLDENGSAAVAVLPDDASPAPESEKATPKPTPAVFFPVTDYKKFIGQFQPDDATAATTGVTIAGHALVAGHKDSFAVFMLPDHKEQLSKVIASQKGIDSLLGSFKPWIGRHQVSLVATPAGSKMLLQAALALLKQAEAAIVQSANAQQAGQLKMGLKIDEQFLAGAAEQVDAFAIGLALDKHSNVSIDSHTSFVAGKSWAAALNDMKSSEGKPFLGLQATPFMFAADMKVPEGLSRGFAAFSADSMDRMNETAGGAALDPQQRKQYIQAMESIMKGSHEVSFVMATPKPGEAMLDGAAAVMRVDDAKGFLDRYKNAIKEMNAAMKTQPKPAFQISDVKEIDIDGAPGLSLTVDMSGMLAMQNNPAAAKVMPQILGPTGKLTARMLVADDRTVIVGYGSEERLKESLAAFKSGKSTFATDPNVAATLKLLSPHAQLVGLADLKGYMNFIGGLIAAQRLPVNLPALPDMPPLGFAAHAGSHGLDTQLVLPIETMLDIAKTIRGAMSQHTPGSGA